MKRFFVISSILAASAMASLAQDDRQALIYRITSDMTRTESYTYNDMMKLSVRTIIDESTGGFFRYSHEYDEDGLLTMILTEQDLTYMNDAENLTPVSKVVYSYYEDGTIATRDNYNRNKKTGNLDQSAHIEYSYDDNGNRVRQEQFWVGDSKPFFRILSSYDNEGRLMHEEEYQQSSSDPDTYKMTGKLLYSYNDDGMLTQVDYSVITVSGDGFELYKTDTYEYSNGDMTRHQTISAEGTVSSRNDYTYELLEDAKDAIVPYSPEFSIDNDGMSQHIRIKEENWAQNLNTGMLSRTYDLLYFYQSVESGVAGTRTDRAASMSYDSATRSLGIYGADSGYSLRVCAASGETVMSVDNCRQSVDLSRLAPGVYVVTLHKAGCETMAYKIAVK